MKAKAKKVGPKRTIKSRSWLGDNPGDWPATDRIYLQQRMLTDGFVPPFTGESVREWMPKITGYIRWMQRQIVLQREHIDGDM